MRTHHARAKASTPQSTTRDPVRTRKAILDAAVAEFSAEGFAGARIERISTAAGTNDRMIYYYFGNKEGLCLAAIEAIYEDQYEAESNLTINMQDPVAALETIVEFHWTYYESHPEFINLLASENLLKAKHIKKSERLPNFASPMIGLIQRLIALGIQKKRFRDDVIAEHLLLTICSITYFYLSNIHTLSSFLNRNLERAPAKQQWLDHAKHVVVASVIPGGRR